MYQLLLLKGVSWLHHTSHPRIPGIIKINDTAMIPEAYARPTCKTSSVTALLCAGYWVGSGCARNEFPISPDRNKLSPSSYLARTYSRRTVEIFYARNNGAGCAIAEGRMRTTATVWNYLLFFNSPTVSERSIIIVSEWYNDLYLPLQLILLQFILYNWRLLALKISQM